MPTSVDDASARLATKIEIFNSLRGVIQHEDDLVNQRFTWLLTFEGFLLAGFFLVQSGMLKDISRGYVIVTELSLAAVLCGSLWICFITGQLIAAATAQVSLVGRIWKRQFPEESWGPAFLAHWYLLQADTPGVTPLPADCVLPPIHGEFRLSGGTSVVAIPFVLLLINSIAAVACVVIAIWRYRHG